MTHHMIGKELCLQRTEVSIKALQSSQVLKDFLSLGPLFAQCQMAAHGGKRHSAPSVCACFTFTQRKTGDKILRQYGTSNGRGHSRSEKGFVNVLSAN